MYYISTEIPPTRSPLPEQSPAAGAAAAECDFCGRPLSRESALQRLRRGDEGVELVPMCRECELGAD